ncbi:hypothetical protein Pyrfu_1944 [Pyrolobus fumarii 1A]|uniref:Uncharacterized protein n=1 Tax=Pyrolobus fumarii (strain DSM 11204 / 1A) TaxID=694429 RepID=G0EDJ3_PYRF1|nr:hypothetical protein [Pyrolobus fumarii]AEM39797.1 hypothetical protein Pyrfu_1944 [Pyrolobus fumarii 1A]
MAVCITEPVRPEALPLRLSLRVKAVQPRKRLQARVRYHSLLLRTCGDATLLAWLSLLGVLVAVTIPGGVYGLAYVAPPEYLPVVVTVQFVTGVAASFFTACRGYLGLRAMIPGVLYSFAMLYLSASLVSTLLRGDSISALSATLNSMLLAVAAVYEELMIRGRSLLLTHMMREMREFFILSSMMLLGAFVAAMHGNPALAALLVAVAYYPVYVGLREYFEKSVWGWGGAPIWERLVAMGLTSAYVSLVAYVLTMG